MTTERIYRIQEDDGSITELTLAQAVARSGMNYSTIRKRLNEQHKRKAADVFASAAAGAKRGRAAIAGKIRRDAGYY